MSWNNIFFGKITQRWGIIGKRENLSSLYKYFKVIVFKKKPVQLLRCINKPLSYISSLKFANLNLNFTFYTILSYSFMRFSFVFRFRQNNKAGFALIQVLFFGKKTMEGLGYRVKKKMIVFSTHTHFKKEPLELLRFSYRPFSHNVNLKLVKLKRLILRFTRWLAT